MVITFERVVSARLSQAVVAEVHSLLWTAFADEFSDEDFENAFGGEHVLARDGGELVAHAAVVPRELVVRGRSVRAGYVEAVATLPARHGEQLGSRVMRLLDTGIEEGYELGALLTGRHSFYERLGWERWRGPSYVIEDGTWTRTADDDDGLMVLRFGSSADVDLASPIACHARPGDAW